MLINIIAFSLALIVVMLIPLYFSPFKRKGLVLFFAVKEHSVGEKTVFYYVMLQNVDAKTTKIFFLQYTVLLMHMPTLSWNIIFVHIPV